MKKFILLILALSMLLSSCSIIADPVCYVVDFNTDGAEEIDSQNVNPGETATKPTDPEKDGYTFLGWFYKGTEWNFEDPIETDMTLVAMWEKNSSDKNDENEDNEQKFTVTFDKMGGTGDFPPQEIPDGSLAVAPLTNPKKDGYTFLGWYYDGVKWDFGTAITKDITLTAKWQENAPAAPNTHTVTFDTDGAGEIPSQTIAHGEKATKPTDPTKDGYTFLGWYFGEDVWSFIGYVVTEDMTLTAKWEEISDGGIEFPFICYHVDKNGDGECDKCNEKMSTECTKHVDKNGDGKCDICGIKVATKCEHVDDNGDNKCDYCGKNISGDTIEYPWADDEPIELVFQMSMHSCGQALPSGCMRYLAGEDIKFDATIDTMVMERNADAYWETNVKVTYMYYDDNHSANSWGKSVSTMYNTIRTNAPGSPDMYCNFQYDLLALSLKGMCANLKSTNYSGKNYFEFLSSSYDESSDNLGYMYEYMESTTLDKNKMYILASDYFMDLIRAFFVVPVNVKLLESVGMNVTGDIDGKTGFTIDDFYKEVYDRNWNYDLVEAYSAAVYEKGDQNTGTSASIHDTLGFAIGNSGLHGSAMLYTQNIYIIEDRIDPDTGARIYYYPDGNEGLYALAYALSDLFDSTGVLCVTSSSDYREYGSSSTIAIRTRFCSDKILFGSTVMLGSLEYETYQVLKNSPGSGFGIVPVPLYYEIAEGSDDTYPTAIHNIGRPGIIAYNTNNFSACTAFLNYQSTQSADILDYYYDYMFQYNIADGSRGTVEMLQYIRSNVRSTRDKAYEDAIGYYTNNASYSWHSIFANANFNVENIRYEYTAVEASKEEYLKKIYAEFPSLPE